MSERRFVERELTRHAERYRVLVEAISTVVWRTDRHGQSIAADGWEAFTGESDGDRWEQTVHADDVERVRDAWQAALADGSVYDCTYRLRGADDCWRHVRVRGVPVMEGGEPIEWIGVISDITEQMQAEESLRRAAREDALTGLPNRAHFVQSLAAVLAHREPDAAVIYVDVDRFKSVNDRFGHEVGDRLLKAVAARLLGAVRPSDLVSRLSGMTGSASRCRSAWPPPPASTPPTPRR